MTDNLIMRSVSSMKIARKPWSGTFLGLRTYIERAPYLSGFGDRAGVVCSAGAAEPEAAVDRGIRAGAGSRLHEGAQGAGAAADACRPRLCTTRHRARAGAWCERNAHLPLASGAKRESRAEATRRLRHRGPRRAPRSGMGSVRGRGAQVPRTR